VVQSARENAGEQGHDPADLHQAIDRGYQWGEEIPIRPLLASY